MPLAHLIMIGPICCVSTSASKPISTACAVAGDPGWDIVWKQAEGRPEPGELFAAGVLAFESDDAARIDKVLSLATTKPELGRAVVSATGWLPDATALKRIAPLLNHASASARAIGIAAHAIRRLNPGNALEKALNDPDLALRARAMKLIARWAMRSGCRCSRSTWATPISRVDFMPPGRWHASLKIPEPLPNCRRSH